MYNGPVLVVDMASITFLTHGEAISARTRAGRVLGVIMEAVGSDRDKVFAVLDHAARSATVTTDGTTGPTQARVAWYNPFTYTVTVGSVEDEDHRVFRFAEPVTFSEEGEVGEVDGEVLHLSGKLGYCGALTEDDVTRDLAAMRA